VIFCAVVSSVLSVAEATEPAATLAAFGPRVLVPGMTGTNLYGDTWDGAWSSNGVLYLQHNDGIGFNGVAFVHDRLCRLEGSPQVASSLSGTNLDPGKLSNSLLGSPCYSTGLYEVDGVLYHNICYSQQVPGAYVFTNTSTLKSTDGGKNWINDLGQTNTMPPNDVNDSMFPSGKWGEVNFVKYGAGGVAPDVDNAQTYVYLCSGTDGFRLARVLRTDLPKLDRTKIGYYKGGDGMLDSNWTNDIDRSVVFTSLPSSATAMTYNEGLGRYIMTSFNSDSFASPPVESTLRVLEAPHPWGPWTLLLDENVNDEEGDNLTWAFLMPKFTSSDGTKMWMSVAGRAPYGLQFMPIHLTTQLVQMQEAENSVITGGFVATNVPGYSGSGYVSGMSNIGDKCDFAFAAAAAGQYIVQVRYNTGAYRNLGFYVNGKSRGPLLLGKSEQTYATWTDISLVTWLASGTNLITLQCDDSVGSVNLDKVMLALYTTNVVSALDTKAIGGGRSGVTTSFDTLPSLPYALEWKSNLTTTAWQPLTNFTGTGAAVQFDLTNGSRQAFYRIGIRP
jgi:hypothetical protein